MEKTTFLMPRGIVLSCPTATAAVEGMIPGLPAVQPRPRVSTRGGFARAYTPATHPVHKWKEEIRQHFEELISREPAFMNLYQAERVSILSAWCFVVPRPMSHYRRLKTSPQLREDAPSHPAGDIDNYLKPALDAINGVVWADDTVIACGLSLKRWGRLGEPPHARYCLWVLPDDDASPALS